MEKSASLADRACQSAVWRDLDAVDANQAYLSPTIGAKKGRPPEESRPSLNDLYNLEDYTTVPKSGQIWFGDS